MSRQFSILCVLLGGAVSVTAGCTPQQPFFLLEDGDLSHYIDTATEIEYPDVETCTLDEVSGAIRPFSLDNPDPSEIWELTLEEAVRYALQNSKVIRELPAPGFTPSILSNPEGVPSVYGPALREANPRFGVPAALAAFDAQLTSSMIWEKNDVPLNTSFNFRGSQQDLASFQARLSKMAATGGTWSLTHNVDYDLNDSTIRFYPSDWNVNLEAEFRQPLMQSKGVQFNRIAGPGSIPGWYNGVMIARINTDISLTDFESQVRNLVNDVERGYWDLYLAYRNLHALTEGRDKSLETWRKVRAEYETGTGSAQDEAQAQHQLWEFTGAVEEAQNQVFTAESNLRYVMGLAATDGRLIRPADEPTTAKVGFEWCQTHCEAMVRSVELRRQKWQVKRFELELIAAKNFLLPRLDAVGRYRWRGLGDDLIDPSRPGTPFDNAYQSLTGGDFQEWRLGLELSLPLGYRKEMAGVRHAQLGVARERAVLQDMELAISRELSQALRDLDKNYKLAQTRFNQRLAAQTELEAWETTEKVGLSVRDKALDRKLDAQRRLATSEVQYYTELVEYNKSIAQVHFRKGSLLEYNGVCLAEGPWPAKAYFDATRRARARDAGFYLDYGYTRPKVISRGAYEQHAGTAGLICDTEPAPEEEAPAEMIPTPLPEFWDQLPTEKQLPMAPEAISEPEEAGPGSAEEQSGNTPPPDASGYNRPTGKGDNYDLGSLELTMFAAKPASVGPATAVQPVGYQQVDPVPQGSKPKPAENAWKSTKISIAGHESVANPSTTEADRNASGWKRVQR